MKKSAALAAMLACSITYADELRRCTTADDFSYWTPTLCAPGDRTNGIATPKANKTFAEQVKSAECTWRAMRIAMAKEPKEFNPTPRRAPPLPNCD
jgi:hypothetical protein